MLEKQRLYRKLATAEKYWNKEISKARQKHTSSDEVEALISEASMETGMIWDDINYLESSSLRWKASRLHVPVPPMSDTHMWDEGQYSRRWYLSDAGIYQVRTLVRTEEKARREGKLAWVSPLTGLVGVITGLAAVLANVL